MPFITIFTPTFNRCNLIDNLYQSLLKQISKNFEWLVVDDGSTDNTENYFNSLIKKENPFPIHYIKQQNGGKHRAINNGIKQAKGDLFFIVDSDDTLTPNAIEKIIEWSKTLDCSKKWAGFSGLRGFSKEINVGQYNKASFIDAKNTERQQYHLEGDKAEIYFTEILRKYPFPEFIGENFISEEVVWNAIANDGFYLRWFNEIIYICEYLENGLTKDKSRNRRNPQGTLCWAKGQLNSFPKNIRKRILAIGEYSNAVSHSKSLKQIASDLNTSFFNVIISKTILNMYLPLFHFFSRNKP